MSSKNKAKILIFDLENSPNRGYCWGKYDQNIIRFDQEFYLMSFSWKWHGESKTHCLALPDFPGYSKNPTCDKALCKKLWELFDEADITIGHNIKSFDHGKANSRFIYHGMLPHSPVRMIDTLLIARRHFKFNCNKLDSLCRLLGIGTKVRHTGSDLWFDCMNGDQKAWNLMKKYNCLTPDHKVLTTDLRWVEIGSLEIGDTILGFDENPNDSVGIGRKYQKSVVLGNRRAIDFVYEVELSNGDKIKCTREHQWLTSPISSSSLTTRSNGLGGQKWRRTDELMFSGQYLDGKRATSSYLSNGTVIYKYMDQFSPRTDFDSGWVSGMFDGEESLSNARGRSYKGSKIGGFSITISQKTGQELDKLTNELIRAGVDFTLKIQEKNGGVNDFIQSTLPIGLITINGKWHDRLKFLGTFRPQRLINNIDWDNLPRMEGRNSKAIVTNIRYLGKKEIVILETSTKTFISDGYAMHNCQDVKLTEKLYERLRPYSDDNVHVGLFEENPLTKCPCCGSPNLVKRGYQVASTRTYRQFVCKDCGRWCRSVLSEKDKKADIR